MASSNYAELLFGRHAVHVPAWLYVQHQGDGTVSFAGSGRVPDGQHHPLRFGSDRTHQLVVGELVVRPHLVVGTDALRGSGVAHLLTGGHDIEHMLGQGEVILGDPADYR